MITRSLTLRLVVAATAISLALAPATAFAARVSYVSSDVVPGHPVFSGTDLGGMTAAEARTAIAAVGAPVPMAPILATAAGAAFSFDANGAAVLEVDSLVAAAFESTTAPTYMLAPRYTADPARVAGWVDQVKARVERAAVNARYAASGRSLVVLPSATGLRLDAGAAAALSGAVVAEADAGGAAQPVVALATSVVAPSVTPATIDKGILVVLGKRKLTVYQGGGIMKTYRCAIGQRRYPTPRGAFKVIKKVSMPTWYNPGSAWARRMPRYIKPGPRNPLGTRALYIDAPGIRIHGTNNVRSVGTPASHGCVRMLRRDIERLYPQIPVGTPVFIVK